MPTLKEFLAQRKRASAQAAQEIATDTDINAASTTEFDTPYVPIDEWDALGIF